METTVLVVGAGPVGLTMAAELARYGIAVRIVEKAARRTDKSKALVLWSRTLELMDRAGCATALVDAGFKVTAANIIANGRQIAHFRLDEVSTPHAYALMLPQSETERLLEAHLNACGAKVEREVELADFVSGADGVTATLKHKDGGQETLKVSWLIGCDGAHSTVRHGLHMDFQGNTLVSRWILADVHLAGVSTPAAEVDTFWHADGVLVMFPISPGRYRIIADVGDTSGDQPRADPTLSEVQAIMDRRGPGGIQASSPIWLASFAINERKVKDYRAGRIFIAGDAAHVHSPAGGQGMNTGMQDAFNLAWKLAMVHRNLAAAEPLLESYSIERSAVGREVLANAGHLTTLAVLKGGIPQAIRNHVASLLFGLPPLRRMMANTLAELSIGYAHSPLTEPRSHVRGRPGPGERAPILDLNDLVGAGNTPRFALFAQSHPDGIALIERHGDLLDPKIRAPFADDGIWLVRPDGYVSVAANAGDWASIARFLEKFTKITDAINQA